MIYCAKIEIPRLIFIHCAFLQLMYLHKLVYNFGNAMKIILTYGLWVMKGGGINAH